MKRPDPIEQALDRLGALKNETGPAVTGEFKGFLKNRSNLVVAKAAKVASHMRAAGLIGDLVAAFRHFMENPQKRDKGCAALTEIATALYELDHVEPEIYLWGIHHVQMEGSFGPPVDAAAKLRAISALGLVRTHHPDALDEVVSLLVDKWPQARIGGVRALASNGGEAGTLLLKLLVLSGESEPDVLAECFSGLLASGRRQSLSLIAGYLDSEDPAIAEVALLALGSSRLPEALDLLKARWDRTAGEAKRRALLLAIAMIRSEAAIDFLLGLLNRGSASAARVVIPALALFRDNERVREKIEAAVLHLKDPGVTELFRQEF